MIKLFYVICSMRLHETVFSIKLIQLVLTYILIYSFVSFMNHTVSDNHSDTLLQ